MSADGIFSPSIEPFPVPGVGVISQNTNRVPLSVSLEEHIFPGALAPHTSPDSSWPFWSQSMGDRDLAEGRALAGSSVCDGQCTRPDSLAWSTFFIFHSFVFQLIDDLMRLSTVMAIYLAEHLSFW